MGVQQLVQVQQLGPASCTSTEISLMNNRSVIQLPKDFEQLISLRTLDLSYCSALESLPPSTVSSVAWSRTDCCSAHLRRLRYADQPADAQHVPLRENPE